MWFELAYCCREAPQRRTVSTPLRVTTTLNQLKRLNQVACHPERSRNGWGRLVRRCGASRQQYTSLNRLFYFQ